MLIGIMEQQVAENLRSRDTNNTPLLLQEEAVDLVILIHGLKSLQVKKVLMEQQN